MSIHQQHSDDSRQQMIQRTECSEAWARRVDPNASMTDSLKNWATDFEERQMTFRQAAVNGGQFPRKYGVGKQSDAVIRDSQLTALNFL